MRRKEEIRRKNWSSDNAKVEKEDAEHTEISGTLVLAIFAIYILLGALLIPLLLNQELDYLSALYFNFVSLTAIDFSNIIPRK